MPLSPFRESVSEVFRAEFSREPPGADSSQAGRPSVLKKSGVSGESGRGSREGSRSPRGSFGFSPVPPFPNEVSMGTVLQAIEKLSLNVDSKFSKLHEAVQELTTELGTVKEDMVTQIQFQGLEGRVRNLEK